jgi:DNA-binding Lrp family transcriptional regulator
MNSKPKHHKKPELSKQEMDIAREIQGNIPLTVRPFQNIAKKLGLTEGEVIKTVSRLSAEGTIRKFGAIIRHRRIGYTNNIMVVWAVPDGKIEETGKKLAAFPEVTHCYERTPPFAEKYNLFTMIHLKTDNDESLLMKMSDICGVTDFTILRSLEEFKKESMEYF